MTSKEKANELVELFRVNASGNHGSNVEKHNAIECALNCVEQVMIELQVTGSNRQSKYWYEVEQELILMK